MARVRKVRISDASAFGTIVDREPEEHPPGEQVGYRPVFVPELQLRDVDLHTQLTPAQRYAAKYGDANWATRHFLGDSRE